MTASRRAALALLLAVFASNKSRAAAEEPRWRDAASLTIEGKGWEKTAGPFARLPESVKDKFSALAWQLSAESAGLCARFVTDAAAVSVRWSVANDALAMPHMPATGVSGVDLYARTGDGSWRFVGNGRPEKKEGNLAKFHFPDGAKPGRECLLYFPLYNGTKSLEIGVTGDARLEPAGPRPEGRRAPVVVYGTSIVQGGCASRPGMAWPAILGRLLDRPVVNLGFSGNGTMEPPVGDALAEVDAAAYVVDCIWNMNDDPALYRDHVARLVRSVRKAHPDTPILFVGQSHMRPDAHPTKATLAQEAAVRELQNEGAKGLVIVPGTDLVGADGEGTVDGVHPNDLGMERQARALLPAVKKALDEPKGSEASKGQADGSGKQAPAAGAFRVISQGKEAYRYQAFPDACRLKNGDIVAVFYAGYAHVSAPNDEFPRGGRVCLVRSSDEGRTWTEPAVLYDDENDNRDPHVSQLDDGTLVCTLFSLAPKGPGDPKDSPGKGVGVQVVTSRDGGKTWDAKARTLFSDWYCSAPVRQLPDGTCVLGLYREDPETRLSVGGTARSTDRGRTWEAPVAIKAPGASLNAETDVIRLNDGRLYAALRSTKNDMYEATSSDDGRSWSEAKKAGFPAHSPHLNRLSTGAILLGHRLPQTSIHVSRDDAKTWQGPYRIDSCIGAYPATVELKDGSVLIVYYTEGSGSAVRARRFRLTPDGIEFLPL